MKFDIVIIGSGLSGLVCGSILSREGYNVAILEKNDQIGGNLQTFERNGHTFDTGMHYVGSLDEGQTLHAFFKYLNIARKLKLRKLDANGYDVISFGDDNTKYRHAQGYDNFIEVLCDDFPHEYAGIKAYTGIIQQTIRNIPLYDLENAASFALDLTEINRCAMHTIQSVVTDKRLQCVIAGANALYHGAIQRTPLYLHACIRNSFIDSTWRTVDGSDQIARLLADEISSNGGTILTNEEVSGFKFGSDEISGVKTKSGKYFETQQVISSIHPAACLQLIPDDRLRSAYRSRIESLENTPGFFTLYLIMKKDAFPYLNHNVFHYNSENYFDDHFAEPWPDSFMLYTPATSDQEDFTRTVSVLSFMNYDAVRKWEGTIPQQRGQDYKDFQEQMAERLFDLVEKRFPGFRKKVEQHYISTPLTFRDYTNTKEGTAYGILKDCGHPARSIVLPRTRIPNLCFTGQNLNIHGILGTTISAVITCSELLGLKYLTNKIIHA